MAKVVKETESKLNGFVRLTEDEADSVMSAKRGGGRGAIYPLADLEIGEGIFVPAGQGKDGKERKLSSLRNTLYTSANRQEVRVKVTEGDRKGIPGCFVVRVKEKEKKEESKKK